MFWNIKNICSECIFILFAQVRNPVLRRFANFLKVYFEFDLSWLGLSRFHDCMSKLWVLVLIALISKINGSYLLWSNMGTELIHD